MEEVIGEEVPLHYLLLIITSEASKIKVLPLVQLEASSGTVLRKGQRRYPITYLTNFFSLFGKRQMDLEHFQ